MQFIVSLIQHILDEGFGKSIRNLLSNNFQIIEIYDFADYQIFSTAIITRNIYLQKRNDIQLNMTSFAKATRTIQLQIKVMHSIPKANL